MKCRVANCTRLHQPDQVCCRNHWFDLPKRVRDDIWRLYRVVPDSDEHREAVFNALAYLEQRDLERKAARS